MCALNTVGTVYIVFLSACFSVSYCPWNE